MNQSNTYITTGNCQQCNAPLGTCTCPCSVCRNFPCTCYTTGTGTGSVYYCPICGSASGCSCCYNTSSITYFPTKTLQHKYIVFRLPKEKLKIMPNKVYVSGRLVTVGILGSDVQAAFAGNKLVFGPGELDGVFLNKRSIISIDYGDWLYHYNVNTIYGYPDFEDNSNIVKCKLVSKIAQR